MALVPVGGEAALGAWTLVAALGFCVCAGLLWIWRNTIGAVFARLARFSIGIRWGPSIHPLAPLGKIDTSVEHELSKWADRCQKQAGLAFHYMAVLYETTSREISRASAATLDFGHYVIHDFVPAAIERDLAPLRHRTNKAAATAASAAAAAALVKHREQAHEHAQTQTNATTKAHADTTTHEVTHTKTIVKTVETQVVRNTHVITSVVDVRSLTPPLGRTIAQIKRRLGKIEALAGATAMALAMANVLGLPNPRCLRDGPLGKVSRALCGIPTRFLNDLLGLLADFLILENICTVLPWLESAASEIGTPLVAGLTDVGAGLCRGSHAPAPLVGPMPSIPFLIFGAPVVEV